MSYTIVEEKEFRYVDVGEGQPLVLLHGLFGALSNWQGVIDKFKENYRVFIPILPLYSLPLLNTNVPNLAKYVDKILKFKGIENAVLIGNSLGGHVSLLYIINHAPKYCGLVLTGSSGLYENGMGGSYPKRGSYDYIKNKTEETFFNPETATKELVDEVFDIVNDRNKIIRVLAMSKSAIRQNLSQDLKVINQPTLLIWGKNDIVTPPEVCEEFHKLIPQSEIAWVDRCGHAPMMEYPDHFNDILADWLTKKGL